MTLSIPDTKERTAADADAAAERLKKGLRSARAIVRDYRDKLVAEGQARESGKNAFNFER